MKAKWIALLVVVVLALIILVQNTHVVAFRLLFWAVEMSLVVLVLLMLVIGFVLGFIVAKLMGRKKHQPVTE
jgi:uncharacterized integral membrane protein